MASKLLHRALWHLTRSPLGPVYKQGLRLLHRATIAKRQALARQLTRWPTARALAEQLAQNGYVVISDAIDRATLQALDAAAQTKLSALEDAQDQQSLTHKSFWTRLLDQDMVDGKLPISSPYVQFATQPVVLEILAGVYGELPILDYVLLTLSRHTASARSYSQLWHRDHDDTRVVKLFFYLTDVVDEKDGPFSFIPGPVSDRFGFTRHSHRDDDRIFHPGRAAPADVKAMIAPRLSVFMVETSRCLHMGSRVAPGHSRLLYTATYLSSPSMYPGRTNKFLKDRPLADAFEEAVLDVK